MVELGGAGPPIVVLHGLMGRAATWWPVARWLADHGRVVGLDARGHGRSAAAARGRRSGWRPTSSSCSPRPVPRSWSGIRWAGCTGSSPPSARPDLVRALVVEDMGVDFVGAPDTRAWFAATADAVARARGGAGGVRRVRRLHDRVRRGTGRRLGAAGVGGAHHGDRRRVGAAELVGTCCRACGARRCSSRRRRASCPRGRWRRWRGASRTPGTWSLPGGPPGAPGRAGRLPRGGDGVARR